MFFVNGINKLLEFLPIWFVYFIGFIPFIFFLILTIIDEIGPDPLLVLEHKSGIWSLNFLIFALSISFIDNFISLKLIKFRRCIGLLAFYYALLHFLLYLILDKGLNFSLVYNDITKRPYIFFGFLAFLCFFPLVLTSNNFSKKLLGIKVWLKIHTLIYAISIFSIIHYILLVKSWPIQPVILSILVLSLLMFKLKKIGSLFLNH